MKQLIDNMSGGYSMNQRSKKPLSSYKVPLERSSASKFDENFLMEEFFKDKENLTNIYFEMETCFPKILHALKGRI